MFNRMGKRLKEGDWIELRPGGTPSGPQFKVETKRRILRQLQRNVEVAFIGYAKVAGVEMSRETVTLRLPDGREVVAAASSEALATVTLVVPEYATAWLRIGGTASIDVHDRIDKITELEDVEVVDEEQALIFDRVLARMEELESLDDGWLDGHGTGLAGQTSPSWAREILLLVMGETALPKPGIFPTPDGHLQAEWSIGEIQITLIFDLPASAIIAEVSNSNTDEETIDTFTRADGDSLVEYINQLNVRVAQ